MDVPRRTTLAVLSAGTECLDRVWRLYGAHGSLALALISDPEELLRVVASLTRIQKRAGRRLAGVLIDLTTPRQVTEDSQGAEAEQTADLAVTAESAIKVIDQLAELGIGSAVPLIAVSANDRLRAHLAKLGVAPRAFLSPSDDDATWRRALDPLIAPRHTPRLDAVRRARRQRERIIPPATAVRLRADLWFDPAACELLRRERRTPLTARESALLASLLRTPCTYIPASELAHRLTPPGAAYPVDAHSIEQAVSTLRRKLGERKGQPNLLRVRRGVGYGIFPEISHASEAPTSGDARAKAVEFSRQQHRET